jgi:hypothetical protein
MRREFEDIIKKELGDKIRADKEFAQGVYRSLCNIDWIHEPTAPKNWKEVLKHPGSDPDRSKEEHKRLWDEYCERIKGWTYSCTWRYAGGLVAEIRNEDNRDSMAYCNWYCSGGEGLVYEDFEKHMAQHGWIQIPMD